MKKIILALTFGFSVVSAFGQLLEWSKSIDGLNGQQGSDIKMDVNGNTYVSGSTSGLTDISGSVGITTGDELTAGTGTGDGIVINYNSAGVKQWITHIPNVQITQLFVHSTGVFFTGKYNVAITVMTVSGPVSFPAPMSNDVLVGKLALNGDVISVGIFGNFPGEIRALHVPADGSSILASFTLNGGVSASINGTNYSPSGFGISGFLVSLNPATYATNWVNLYSGGFYSELFINGIGVAEDPITTNDVVIVAGTFADQIDLDVAAGTQTIFSNGWDGFLAKFDLSTGAYVGKAIIGANDWANNNYIRSMQLTAENTTAKIIVGGQFNAACDFDPSATTVNLSTIQYTESFVAKYDLSFNYEKAISIRGINQQDIVSLSIPESSTTHQKVTVFGESDGNLTFTAKDAQGNLIVDSLLQVNPALNTKKPFALWLAYDATDIWVEQGFFLEGTHNTTKKAIGSYTNGISNTVEVAIIANINNTMSIDMNPTALDVIYSNTSVPTTASDFIFGKYNNQSCLSDSTLSITTCSSAYTFGSQNLTTSGTYTEVFQNFTGCDSTVTLNLTLLQSTSSTQSITVCGSYTSPSGLSYASSGIILDTIPNAQGCDSLLTINLTVLPIPTVSVLQNNDGTLTATGGTTYQWFNCSSNQPIAGATTATFTPLANGLYSAIVSNASGCSDTTLCITVNNVGISEFTNNSISMFPNPVLDQLTVTAENQLKELLVIDLSGRVVKQVACDNLTTITVNLFDVSVGSYQLVVVSEANYYTYSIIKQ